MSDYETLKAFDKRIEILENRSNLLETLVGAIVNDEKKVIDEFKKQSNGYAPGKYQE